MEYFELRAPIKAQLEAILQDYPAGQMMSEGLQNAEDGHASRFSLMLDLRCHATDGLRHPNLQRCHGSSFILADNGQGFGEANWMSLQNLHQSEKRNSPADIGRFGMGSRSYFHFADIVQVASRNRYIGIDPLLICGNKGGWSFKDLSDVDDVEATPFSIPEFQCNFKNGYVEGSIFRIPLRLLDHVKNGLGPEISDDDARTLINGWKEQFEDGRSLLFLKSIRCIDLWIWENGDPEPTKLLRRCKVFEPDPTNEVKLFQKLPPIIPLSARESFATLKKWIFEDVVDLNILGGYHSQIVKITGNDLAWDEIDGGEWLLFEAFMPTDALLKLMEDCASLPVAGIAIPIYKLKNETEPISGAPFCSLPIGDIATRFPVHINAVFQIHKNRRSLWLGKVGNVGKQEQYMRWNEALLEEAIPILWLAALKEMKKQDLRVSPFFPIVTGDSSDDWQRCAIEFYRRLSGHSLLLHDSSTMGIRWLKPCDAISVALPSGSDDYKSLRDEIESVYRDSPSSIPLTVFLDPLIEKSCVEYSGLKSLSLEEFIKKCLLPHSEPEKLSPVLLGLAELCGRNLISLKHDWRRCIENINWVKLKNGTYTKLGDAFDIAADNLSHFPIVQQSMPVFDIFGQQLDIVLPILRVWGLKTELTWNDVYKQAHYIEQQKSIVDANHLLDYLYKHRYDSTSDSQAKIDVLKKMSGMNIIPSTRPGELLSENSISPCLQSSSDIFAKENLEFVWAAHSYASKDLVGVGLTFKQLEPLVFIQQIASLALIGEISFDNQAKYIFVALKALVVKVDQVILKRIFTPLLKTCWVPCVKAAGFGSNRLVEPCHVVQSWVNSLQPKYELVPLHWKSTFPKDALEAMGIAEKANGKSLAEDLVSLKHELVGSTLTSPNYDLAVALASELAVTIENTSLDKSPLKIFVPTSTLKLVLANEVYINDAQLSESGIDIISDRISERQARLLGCTSARDELAQQCELADEGLDENFGQYEEVSTRISGILHDYNNPRDILIEHWQNSDDAGAKKIQYCLDETMYSCSRLVDHRAHQLQRPSLVLQSSKALIGEDIRRVQSLGKSDKKHDFKSAGRFGVGLNCMYMITDTPELLGNDALHIFDPLHVAVSQSKNQHGRKFSCPKLENSFPDMLSPFQSLPNKDEFPTAFRLPLRTHSGKDSFGKSWSPDEVRECLSDFEPKVEELLLFSKNIQEASIVVKSADGQCTEYMRIRSQPSERQTFMQSLPTSIDEIPRKTEGIPSHAKEEMSVNGHFRGKESRSSWKIFHYLCASDQQFDIIRDEYLNGRAALLPHGAAALCTTRRDYHGNLSSYFPLGIHLGVPLLLHGCFSLPTSRKHVPLPEINLNVSAVATVHRSPSQTQKVWNQSVTIYQIATSVVELVFHSRPTIDASLCDVDAWWNLMELKDGDGNRSSNLFRQMLRKEVLHMLSIEQRAFFPVMSHGKVVSYQSRNGCFRVDESILNDTVQSYLVDLGWKLRSLTPFLMSGIQNISPFSGKDLCLFLKTVQLDDMRKLNSEVLLQLLRFILDHDVDFSELHSVPLLILQSGRLEGFGYRCYARESLSLLPYAEESFVHKRISETFREMFEKKTVHDLSVRSARLRTINIVQLETNDLLRECARVHELQLNKNKEWLNLFWQFLKCESLVKVNLFMLLPNFKDWHVLKVVSSSTEGKLVPLGEMSRTFSWHETDKDWIHDTCEILSSTGANILHPDLGPDQNPHALSLMGRSLHAGDRGILNLLKPSGAASLTIEHKAMLLKYFSTRKSLSDSDKADIKGLQLFRLLLDSPSFTSIKTVGTKFVCLKDWPFSVKIPRVEHLAWPLGEFSVIYKSLDVKLLHLQPFAIDFLVPFLQSTGKGGNMPTEVWAFLRELVCKKKFENVIEATRKIVFVPTKSGYVAPLSLLSPNVAIVQNEAMFRSCLTALLPDPALEDYYDVLSKLGMRQHLTYDEIVSCAQILDDMVSNSANIEDLMNPSFLLVEELCSFLEKHWNVSATQSKLQITDNSSEVMNIKNLGKYRIFVVTDTRETSINFVENIRLQARTPKDDPLNPETDPMHRMLCRLSDRIIVPDMAPYASATYLIALHPTTVENKDTKFARVLKTHKSKMNETYGIVSSISDLPSTALVDQICSYAALANETISRNSLLYRTCKDVYQQVGRMLAESSDVQLSKCAKKACVPVEFSEDAAGPLVESRIRFLPSSQCFLNLPRCVEMDILFFIPSLQSVPMCQAVLSALGVKNKPDLNDWALLSRHIGTNSNDLGSYNEALASDIRIIKIVLQEVENILSSSELSKEVLEPIELILIDDKGILVPSSELVWPDDLSLYRLDRCSSLRFVSPELDILNGNKLCENSKLSMLSNCIQEKVTDDTQVNMDVLKPNDFEDGFQMLFESEPFLKGLCRLLMYDYPKEDAESILEVVSRFLSSFFFVWVASSIKTILVDTKVEKELEGSEAEEYTYFDSNTTGCVSVYIKAGIVGDTAHEEEFFKAFARRFNVCIRNATQMFVKDSMNLLTMLKLWKSPGGIPDGLQKNGIRKLPCGPRFRSGMKVPRNNLQYLSQDLFLMFQHDELVALRVEADEDVEYRYARVKKLPVNDDDTNLERKYAVEIERDHIEFRTHNELYKECRDSTLLTHIYVNPTIEVDPNTSSSVDRDLSSILLILCQMETMPSESYRNTLRRLALKWHPDRCHSPRASEYMALINKHAEIYYGNKDFSYFSALNPSAENLWSFETKSSDSLGGIPTTSSWQQDIERERVRLAPRPGARINPGPVIHPGALGNANSAMNLDPRILDVDYAHVLWRSALDDFDIAQVLIVSEKWGASVLHCQQAAEKIIKSIMLRSCGITTEEMKGKGCHDIIALLDSVIDNKRGNAWPVPRDQLQRVSLAYLKSRYLPFPPNGDLKLPSSKYMRRDAEDAMDCVNTLRRWGEDDDTRTLSVPKRGKAILEVIGHKFEDTSDISLSLDPASLQEISTAQLPPPPGQSEVICGYPLPASIELKQRDRQREASLLLS